MWLNTKELADVGSTIEKLCPIMEIYEDIVKAWGNFFFKGASQWAIRHRVGARHIVALHTY